MWNLLKWISSPSKKEEEAAMTAARHHAREKRDSNIAGTQSINDSAASSRISVGNERPQAGTADDISTTSGTPQEAQAKPDLPDREHNRSGKDVFSSAKTPDIIGVRRNAMAYWRKNTNAERPNDLHYYTNLTSPAGYNWQNPFLEDAAPSHKKQAARAGFPAKDLSSLAAFITSNSKNYLAGMHARKTQNELEGQEFDALRSGENLSPSSSENLESYPHYKGGWQAESTFAPDVINAVNSFDQMTESSKMATSANDISATSAHEIEKIPECGVEEIIADGSVEQTLAAQSAQTASLFLAAGDALCYHMNIDFAPIPECSTVQNSLVEDEQHSQDLSTNHAWTLSAATGSPAGSECGPQPITQELTDSLNSIESSPQCDLLFEQSAAAAGAMFPGAKPMRTLDTAETLATSLTELQLMESINDAAFGQRDNDLAANSALTPSFALQIQSQAEQSTTLDSLPEQQFVDVRIFAADSTDTAPEILRALAYDINPDVRFAIAENHNVDEDILCILAADENPYVAHRARKTLQRLEGGQLKQGNFVQGKNANWQADRRKSV